MVMETKHMKKKRLGLGIAAALAAMSFGQQAYGQAAPPWNLNGSDTWHDVIVQALTTANANCPGTNLTNTISNLVYLGGGSGTAETNMGNNAQSIGPMSRNFKQAVLTAHPTWAPTLQNVGGLDAVVIITKNTTKRIKNIQLPTPVGVSNQAATNDPLAACSLGVTGPCYTQLLEVVLSGIDGSGSVAACSDQRRVQAVLDLAAAQGVTTIDHFYRRDDNSGTTNTIFEKINVGLFCNGRARGILGTNLVNHNLNNQDMDPIRRPCPAITAGTYPNATTCTDMTTGLACTAADGNPHCTQGLVVAISDPDPGGTDVTTSIGKRVGNSTAGTVMGYAGREGKDQPNATAPYINTNSYSDALVRLDVYMLSRRLYFQYGPDITDANPLPGATLGGGANQVATELEFYKWATDEVGNNCNGAPGRCNLNSILLQYGFIACMDDCTATVPPTNLCNKQPYPAGASTVTNCFPANTNGVSTYASVACTATAGSVCLQHQAWRVREPPAPRYQVCPQTALAPKIRTVRLALALTRVSA